MSEIVKPTCEELCEEIGFTEVDRESDNGWRHGTYETAVYKRESDGTFWQASYQRQTDGEYNGLRDGDAEITQVEPFEETVTSYRPVNNPPAP